MTHTEIKKFLNLPTLRQIFQDHLKRQEYPKRQSNYSNKQPVPRRNPTTHATLQTNLALHHHPASLCQQEAYRSNHSHRIPLNHIPMTSGQSWPDYHLNHHHSNTNRTTRENHSAAIYWTVSPAEIVSAYKGSKTNRNSMVLRAPSRAHTLSKTLATCTQQERIRIAGRFKLQKHPNTPASSRFGRQTSS